MSSRTPVHDREKLNRDWNHFMKTGTLPKDGVIRAEILESWMRCFARGVDPYTEMSPFVITQEETEALIVEHTELIRATDPFLDGLYELVRDLEMVVFLTDKDGRILRAIGEGAIWEYCVLKNAVVGGSFHEDYAGTNAVCMALYLDEPYQMMAEEHYCTMIHLATCAAAPIHDEDGEIIGCLDLTARYEVALKHPHTLGMIVAAAQFIESQMKLKNESERLFVANEYLRSAMETMSSGLIIFDDKNTITHVNPAAEKILGVNLSTMKDSRIETLIENNIIIDSIRNNKELQDDELILQESPRKIRCLVSLRPIYNTEKKRTGSMLVLKELRTLHKMVHKVVGAQARYVFDDIMGKSDAIRETIRIAQTVASSPSNVFIVGESGTGKEMIAQAIHNASDRRDGPFLAINCAAIPRDLIESELFGYEAGTFTGGSQRGKSGKLELAEGGTLFLDEINGMSLDMQAKLLRVLEERKFLRLGGNRYLFLDVRIIAATNIEIPREIQRGTFRSDLYYRLNILKIDIPPLRERHGDIGLLAGLFVDEFNEALGKNIQGIDDEALAYLESRRWPGNVRELKNWIERAVNLSDSNILVKNDFPEDDFPELHPTVSASEVDSVAPIHTLDELEGATILRALNTCDGNISEAAVCLGISRATLYRKMKKYGLELTKRVSK